MAGELHSPPDDGARARADDVEDEQVRADALADRIASYAPAGSDLRVVPGSLEAEVARLRGSLAWIAHYGTHNGDLRDGWAEAMRAIAHSALRLDPLNCSLCAAGHVPARPCGEPASTAERIARAFHERYEWWAIRHGWSSQVGATVRWEDVPEANKKTMRSTVLSLLEVGEILPGRDGGVAT